MIGLKARKRKPSVILSGSEQEPGFSVKYGGDRVEQVSNFLGFGQISAFVRVHGGWSLSQYWRRERRGARVNVVTSEKISGKCGISVKLLRIKLIGLHRI